MAPPPSRKLLKAILVPSGDHAGSRLSTPLIVSLTAPDPSGSIV
jgi:hypothetical protein